MVIRAMNLDWSSIQYGFLGKRVLRDATQHLQARALLVFETKTAEMHELVRP